MLRRQLRFILAVALAVVVALVVVAVHRARNPEMAAAGAPAGAPGGAPQGEGGGAPGGPGGPGAGGPPPPPVVTVVTLKGQDVTLTTTLPGRVVAQAVAEVRPQVDGIITDRLFEEGQPVTLGDPLYRIDDASYQAAVAAARATVAQAKASYDAAVKTADRSQRLQGRGVVSDQELDTAVADRDAAAAQLQVSQARLLSAEIDLARTTIRAPLTGLIGRSLTTRGALVTAGQTDALSTIRAIDPVLVDVTQSAAEIIEFKRGQTERRLGNADLTVALTLADGSSYPQTGTLTAAEPYVNESTGVVTLRLQFPNPEKLLLPGMYVQVAMPQGVAKDAILAPQQGVSRDRRGNAIAYVVDAENKVEQRDLTVAEARGDDWIVTKGLASGDRIVVEGLQFIGPGAPVQPQERPLPKQEGVEELSSPSDAARAEEEAEAPPTGITVPGADEDAPRPSPEATGGGGGAAVSSNASATEAGSAEPAQPRRRIARNTQSQID